MQLKACLIIPTLKLKATKPVLYILIICKQTHFMAYRKSYI